MRIEIDKNIFKEFLELESKRLLFRKISLNDSKDMYRIRSDDEVLKYLDIHRIESNNDAEKWIQHVWEDFKNENGITWGLM
ncbi:MAG: GNAT family N-acetyltransferase [Ignavibacteriaceae bacterium]|jgi:ribosomal-protein-alanine N-acetyltransferase